MNVEQLFTILLEEKPSINLLNNEDELFDLIPELKKCKNFNQNSEWHIYYVYDHILHVIDNLDINLTLRLSALFHDIGKPDTYTFDERGGHFYNHWVVSQNIFNEFASKYNLNDKLIKTVSNLIYYHDINIDKMNDEELDNLINTFNKEEIIMLFKLKKADLLAQNPKYHYLLDDYENQQQKVLLKYKEVIYDN